MPITFNKRKDSISVDAIKVVNDIFNQAINQEASDVHLEPTVDGFLIRYRVDGIMNVVYEGDKVLYDFVVGRIKILAQLETTGLPRPQEGNIKFAYKDGHVDLRVSVFPTSLGEAIVVRVLESEKFLEITLN